MFIQALADSPERQRTQDQPDDKSDWVWNWQQKSLSSPVKWSEGNLPCMVIITLSSIALGSVIPCDRYLYSGALNRQRGAGSHIDISSGIASKFLAMCCTLHSCLGCIWCHGKSVMVQHNKEHTFLLVRRESFDEASSSACNGMWGHSLEPPYEHCGLFPYGDLDGSPPLLPLKSLYLSLKLILFGPILLNLTLRLPDLLLSLKQIIY